MSSRFQKKEFWKMDIREKSYWPQKLAMVALWIPVFGLHERKANGRTHGYPLSEPVKRGMPVVSASFKADTFVCTL
jgi:hypothetical protein